MLADIRAVTLQDVNAIAREVLDFDRLAASVLGPGCQEPFYQRLVQNRL